MDHKGPHSNNIFRLLKKIIQAVVFTMIYLPWVSNTSTYTFISRIVKMYYINYLSAIERGGINDF